MAREAEIEKYLCKRVAELGGETRKVQWIGRRGAPDRLVMLPELDLGCYFFTPATVWVELKTPGKKPEPHQEREHARMRKVGQRVEVIDSEEGVDKLLEDLRG